MVFGFRFSNAWPERLPRASSPAHSPMSRCPACFARLNSAVGRVPSHTPVVRNYAAFAPSKAPMASTSRLPGAPLGVKTVLESPRQRVSTKGKDKALDSSLHNNADPRSASSSAVKRIMVDHLQRRRPRAAYRAFIAALENIGRPYKHAELVGHVWLLVQYAEKSLALDAAFELHKSGFSLPSRLLVELLSTCYDELLLSPEKLSLVVGWLKDDVARQGDKETEWRDTMTVKVMELLKRMGRNEWALGIFDAWAPTLPSTEVGSEAAWCLAISLKAADEDVRGARDVFYAWRQRWRHVNVLPLGECATDSNPPVLAQPPARPYITLINFLATKNVAVPTRADPLYRLLAILQTDNVPLSVSLYNSLLRVELYRSRFASFWGLWNRMLEDGWRRNRTTWKLAVRAKEWRDTLRRQRGRKIGSPMQSVLPGFNDARAPASRDLFRQLLIDHQTDTGHRPSLRLPIKDTQIVTASMLNTFLRLFISLGDWPAVQVVLESFAVHRCEPDESTHGTIIIGIVRAWEKGKLVGELEEARGIDESENSTARRRAIALGGPQGLELINRITETRRMRVGLWTEVKDGEGGSGELAEGKVDVERPRTAPEWMRRRELRDTAYLKSLLRQCQGMRHQEWQSNMAAVRKEMLPPRKEPTLVPKEQ